MNHVYEEDKVDTPAPDNGALRSLKTKAIALENAVQYACGALNRHEVIEIAEVFETYLNGSYVAPAELPRQEMARRMETAMEGVCG